jgi:hypothetical protein
MKIDIDADCQLLKETMNIQGPALDYFRASNKLLKEGVKSGLSLYEIAILCCRNDDLGESPSKLEMLTEMATELATSAVQNGRWHHSAASRAIAEQLSPEAGVWSTQPSTAPRFFKSASSADMTSLAHQSSSSEEIPSMVQSSASDASSDVGDAVTDREECDDWAASIVADVSLDTKFMEVQSPQREEESLEDHSSVLSSSPRGFWFTRPGENGDSDDDTVNWSPHNSPKITKELADVNNLLLPPRVSFADSLVAGFLLPPANMESSSASPMLSLRRSSGGLSKSQSFAAFHSLSTVSSASSSQHLPAPDDDSTTWKSYFSKFVDLVIARETAAAANQLVDAY